MLLAAGVLASASSASGEEPRASYGAVDPPQVRCDVLARMHERARRGTEQQFYTWLLGYFAGRSAENPGGALRPLPATGPERERIYGQTLQFCQENPTATFGMAVEELVRQSPSVSPP